MTTRIPVMTGGCQCGAVRYAVHAEPYNRHICHCRMCQKAFGGFFAPLVNVRNEDFEVTRGEIAIFRSSRDVERGFCAACGTPLTVFTDGDDHLNVAIGSFDEPARLMPEIQIGIEARMPWFAALAGLPEHTTEAAAEKYGFMDELAVIAAHNHQHPDHDTTDWPPQDRPPESRPKESER
ncbi:GFA family protein [Microbaculum sp. FT89]|uniref:GFA family protein n=1 Tax=Microbaculum sp. FT89 TaxID=3447298 RepID=UPI003F535275